MAIVLQIYFSYLLVIWWGQREAHLPFFHNPLGGTAFMGHVVCSAITQFPLLLGIRQVAPLSSSFTVAFSATQLSVVEQTTRILEFYFILPLIRHLESRALMLGSLVSRMLWT